MGMLWRAQLLVIHMYQTDFWSNELFDSWLQSDKLMSLGTQRNQYLSLLFLIENVRNRSLNSRIFEVDEVIGFYRHKFPL